MLSDTACKNTKPLDKPYKLADEKGMFLLVHPNGSKYFRLKYRIDGKEKLLALGVYPETTLRLARDRRDEARQQIADGIDPAAHKQAVKTAKAESAANSFDVISREWLAKKTQDKSDRPQRLLNHLIPWLGKMPIDAIKPKDVLACLRRLEERGVIETAHRTLRVCSQVFRYAVATGRVERDITQDLRGALPPAKSTVFAAITEPKQVTELLRAIDSHQGSFTVLCGLKIAPLLFQRPGELRSMEWAHIDLDAKEWRYLVTKTDVQHIVPLSRQALEILKELQPLTGHGRYVFPSERTPRGDKCMSENTLNAALRRMGYSKDQMTTHGFRAMARTILDEVLGFRPDFIEHQLAHAVKDPNGRAYNRTAHLSERKKMMQAWADYLDNLKNSGNVVPIRLAAGNINIAIKNPKTGERE
jgi:integrase